MADNLNPINKSASAPPVQDWLETMPENIREWLGSNALLYLIINLNRRLGLQGIKSAVVPDLILQIAIKELRPKDLPDKLSKELGLGREMAFNITKEIEEKMLRPIEVSLRNELGVDIKEIYITPIPKAPTPAIPPPPIGMPVRPQPIAPQEPKSPVAELPVKINVKKPESNNPFGADSWVSKLK